MSSAGECNQYGHELVILTKQKGMTLVESYFSIYNPHMGRPAVPIMKIVGSMLMKSIYNLGEETFVALWFKNHYWQYFCGVTYFQYEKQFDPSEFVHFRKPILEVSAQKLLKLRISLFDSKEAQKKDVLIDTTEHEKNITSPTDSKLHKKILEGRRIKILMLSYLLK